MRGTKSPQWKSINPQGRKLTYPWSLWPVHIRVFYYLIFDLDSRAVGKSRFIFFYLFPTAWSKSLQCPSQCILFLSTPSSPSWCAWCWVPYIPHQFRSLVMPLYQCDDRAKMRQSWREAGGKQTLPLFHSLLLPVAVTMSELANTALEMWPILTMSLLSVIGDTMAAAASPNSAFFSRNSCGHGRHSPTCSLATFSSSPPAKNNANDHRL